jgi:hypothetical protein
MFVISVKVPDRHSKQSTWTRPTSVVAFHRFCCRVPSRHHTSEWLWSSPIAAVAIQNRYTSIRSELTKNCSFCKDPQEVKQLTDISVHTPTQVLLLWLCFSPRKIYIDILIDTSIISNEILYIFCRIFNDVVSNAKFKSTESKYMR